MESKSTDWRPGNTVCRCCLTEGCYKDISTEYFWMGKREVYSEMLTETFDLNIAFSKSGGPNSNSRLICEPCISRLRDASDFKRQVQECERTFMQFLDPGSSGVMTEVELDKEVKIEAVKLEEASDEDLFDDRDFGTMDDDDDDDLDDQPLTKLASKIPKKESVDIMELLDSAKVGDKRKASTKLKVSPTKKVSSRIIKITGKEVKVKNKKLLVKATTSSKEPKATVSKLTVKPEKKKKGQQEISDKEPVIKTCAESSAVEPSVEKEKRKYQRTARAEARFITKNNASSILQCWSVCPFRWKRNRFKCGYCEENFIDCNPLREHVRVCSFQHSVKDIYSKFKEMSLINVDVTNALCRYCGMPSNDVKDMREHVTQHGFAFDANHPDGVLPFSLDKDLWQCVICQEKFNNFLKLYEHMNVHYQHYICATCGKGYMTAPRLRKHAESHVSGTFPCNECGRVFNMRAARDHHKANAHAKAPRYECPHCNMRFAGYYHRMNHLNEAHRVKEVSYRCAHCELSFKTSGKRAIHVRTVHFPPQRDFACSYCEWHFKTSYELKRHMVKHTGERNYHCNVCGKSFPRHRALRAHEKTHEDLHCKWCDVFFKQRNQLIAHVQANHPDMMNLLSAGSDKM